tara:strand:+ start:1103 stop:1315 length:213 start_codon:yes stop_codon:yes gene_type:complete
MSNVEASAGGEVDDQGWPKSPPISDRECIYKCLCNCEQLAGLDRKQVQRLMKQFEVLDDSVRLESEYPPL